MSYDHGPIDTYEIIWNSGHIEYVQAHQVLMPQDDAITDMFSGLFGSTRANVKPRSTWTFHGEIDGHWRLVLHAPAEDIRSVRNVTHTRDEVGGVS